MQQEQMISSLLQKMDAKTSSQPANLSVQLTVSFQVNRVKNEITDAKVCLCIIKRWGSGWLKRGCLLKPLP